MYKKHSDVGFSLIEILVSLLIVSLAAVSIAGLQKIVCDQSRDNFSHTAVLALVSKKLDQVMQYDDIHDVMDLSGMTEHYTQNGTVFDLVWNISSVPGTSILSPIRKVALTVTWLDAVEARQTFTHTSQLSFAMLLKGAGGDLGNTLTYPIANRLGTNNINYFEPNTVYKDRAYVIYDSQLFQASNDYSRADSVPPINSAGAVATGWDREGFIDDEHLADLFSP